jgi:hypothetical protein
MIRLERAIALALRQGDDHRVRHQRERDQQGFVAPSRYRFDHDASPEVTSTSDCDSFAATSGAEILHFEACAWIAAGLKNTGLWRFGFALCPRTCTNVVRGVDWNATKLRIAR